MPKHNNLDIYPFDPSIDARDGVFGFDYNTGGKSKNFKLEHLRYFILEGLDPSNNGFLVNNGYTLVDNILTINAGWQWQINGMLFTNEEDIVFTLEYTATGFVRIDSVYANSNNELLLTSGGESETIAVPPQIPINTLLAFSVNIFDTTIATEEEPVLGNIYLKKIFDKTHQITASGTDVVIPFNLYGRNTVILDGSMTSISGFSFSDLVENPTIAEYPHEGKLILLINRSGHNITLKNEDYASSAVVFFKFDGGNIVIPNNGKLFIKYTDDGLIDILKSWTEITDVTGLPEALDLKLNIADYNDRFKGKYTSLVNLQATHPTSNDGDTAVVDAGPGTNAIEYIWDANEGWVQGNSVGATTTDALPEGSTNLYHTAARVLATLLSGLSSSSGTFSSSDSVLTAFGKIKYLIDNIASLYVQKVTSSGVERAYIINADGSQSTKPTSDFGTIKGTGTTNRISKFTAGGTIGDSQIFDDGTNVGIGTTTPQARLDVKAQGALATDIAFRVRNLTDTQNFLVVNGAGDVYNNGAGGVNSNTFFGENVGRNTPGKHNTCFGYLALRVNNNSQGNNTAFGSGALSNNGSGSDNTCIGSFSLEASISGSQNVAIGSNAGRSIASFHTTNFDVNQSVFIGCSSRALASGQTNQIVIGFSATGLGSNSVVLGNDSIVTTALKGNVGIGTTSPSERLEVNGNVKATGFKTPTGTATQALTANGGTFDLTTKADLVGGKIPVSQLPAYVDDVLEFADLASFPATGESGKIYIAIDTNLTYRWGGSSYVVMSSSLALGETSSTAYRGDRGKIAYDHSQTTGNPHNTTKNDIGLGNVDNTSDLNKPISTATQTALDTKLDKGGYTGTAQDLKNEIDVVLLQDRSNESIINAIIFG